MAWSLATVAAAASGGMFIVLGAAVMMVRPRTRDASVFALFAGSFGLLFVVVNASFAFGDHWSRSPWVFGSLAAVLVSGGAAVWLAVRLAGARLAGRPLVVFVAGGAAMVGLNLWAASGAFGPDPLARITTVPGSVRAYQVTLVANAVGATALLASPVILAWAAQQCGARMRVDAVLAGIVLAMYPAVYTVGNLAATMRQGHAHGIDFAFYGVRIVVLAGCMAAWITWGLRHGHPRIVALAVFAVVGPMAVGVLELWRHQLNEGFAIAAALTRVFAVAVLAFAVLRRQLLGLDVRVKWTIRSGTVAAIFLAVIFVASEGAQLVLGEGNEWIGLAAGAGLVFVLAPLQRFAERVSDTAMPGVKAVVDMDASERAFAYEQAAVAAWADGTLSRDERAMLDRLREGLRLSDSEAARIERAASAI